MFHVMAQAAICSIVGMLVLGGRPLTQGSESQSFVIRGSLVYRERIALPPDSLAIVELRDAAALPGTPVIAEQRIELKGRQVPVAFELSIGRAKLAPGKQYVLRGGIFSRNGPLWVSQDFTIDTAAPLVDVGLVRLARFQPKPFKSELRCGSERISISFPGNYARLAVGGQVYEMRPIHTASGSKLEAVNDPMTSLWSKGQNAILTVRGKTYPECVPLAEVPAKDLKKGSILK